MKEQSEQTKFEDVSNLGVFHLKRLWSSAMLSRNGQTVIKHEDEWRFDRTVMFGLGLALEDTFQYLYQNAPTFEEFEQWILEINGGSIAPKQIERINATLDGKEYGEELKIWFHKIEADEDVLSENDLAFWEENGYVILRDAVTKEEAKAAETAVWEFLCKNPEDPDTWYGGSKKTQGIMVQQFHHEAFRANRNSPRIHKAFAQLWGTVDLWAAIDRVSFNPPERFPDWQFPGPRLHWDMSLELPLHFGIQGILYLTDTSKEQGAFTCIPAFHKRIESWLKSLPKDKDPRCESFEGEATPIAANAGDLIIWHQALPHGSSPNRADYPRIVQYVNMLPNKRDYNDEWK